MLAYTSCRYPVAAQSEGLAVTGAHVFANGLSQVESILGWSKMFRSFSNQHKYIRLGCIVLQG